MRLPTRLPAHHPAQRWVAAAVIALAATAAALVARRMALTDDLVARADNVIYDRLFRLRPNEDRTACDVVIIAVDQKSLDAADAGAFRSDRSFGWPWPRGAWAVLVPFLEQCGAKVVAFDMLFGGTSPYNGELEDDQEFADAVAGARIPVVFASIVAPDGTPSRFAIPVPRPAFGAVNFGGGDRVRSYQPIVGGVPSLALRAATAVAGEAARPPTPDPFLLHFYGPHVVGDGRFTFRYTSAANVIATALDVKQHGRPTRDLGIDPSLFRDKVVIIGATAAALYDLKASPHSDIYPGVEAHATAVENLLHGQRVHPLRPGTVLAITLAAATLASVGVAVPRHTWLKLSAASLVAAALLAVTLALFRGRTIYWLPLAAPLLALLLAVLAAFAWSYLTEGRARQLLFRALSQSLSPEMADEVLRDPTWLARLGGQRREMTVMFTDIAGFTDLSETMEVERLTDLMTFYLEEMSSVVLQDRAYLDKYIGDAIMSFWNGVIDQPDHAALACRAALDMQRRERDIQPQLAERGATKLLTRIGINTGPMALGNMGSSRKFAFTVLGDSVNLGSRLEGANKLYGSQILMAQSTADRVRDKFLVRQLDLLRVKGKKRPMAVYELLAELPGDAATSERVRQYEAALALYRRQDWDGAETCLRGIVADHSDAPAQALLDRVKRLRDDPPPPDWDGVYVAKDK